MSISQKLAYIQYIFALIIVSFPVHSSAISHSLEFEEISRDEGLNHTHVLSIFTDSKGFLWVGTYNGLNKYNGENVMHYEYKYKEAKYSNDVFYDIVEDNTGLLWMGCEGGFYYYDRNKDVLIRATYDRHKNDSSPIIGVRKIKVLNDQKLLLATFGNGLFIYDKVTKKAENFLVYPDSISSYNRINTVFVTANNRILVGTEKMGLKVFDRNNGTFSNFFTKTNLIDKNKINISAIVEDAYNNIWIGTWGEGLYKFDAKTEELSKIESNKIGNIVRDIIIDEQNNLWIASFDQGITFFNTNSSTAINYIYNEQNTNSLRQDMTWTIHLDENKVLWVGTFGSGLNKATVDSKLDLIQYNNKKLSNIYCLGKSPNNTLLIGTVDKGVYEYHIESELVTKPAKLNVGNFNTVDDIVTDNNKRIWMSTSQGLYIIDKEYNTLHQYKVGHPIFGGQYPYMLNLYIDNHNRLWVSIRDGGVAILDLNTLNEASFNKVDFRLLSKEFLLKQNLSTDIISVFNDSEDMYWLTIGGQLFKYNYNTNMLKLAYNNMCFNLLEDSSKNLWMTNYVDLINYSRTDSTYYILGNKYEEKIEFYNIVNDDEGNIWTLSNNGLIKYDLGKQTFSVYLEGHGYKGLSSNYNSGIKLSNGDIAFGGYEGLIIFSPSQLSESKRENTMHFSDFKIYGKKVNQGEVINGYVVLNSAIGIANKVIIPPYIKAFSIEFGTINYNKPEKLKYAYKLEGFDDNWNIVGSLDRKASYTNLKKGEYTLKIAEVIPYINWENNTKDITIVVIPPIHERVWFKVLIPSVILLIIFLLVYLRIRNIKKSKKILEQLVEQRTHELHNSNAELKEISEELKSQTESLAESNATKDKLFSIIAHDLKNPFTTILGFLDLLDLTFNEISDDNKRLFIKRTKESADQAYNLLENLLTWSRSQQGKIIFNPKPLNVFNAINDTITITEPIAIAKDITLVNKITDKNLVLNADEDIIRTVVRNLITNAIKFTPENGIVEVGLYKLDNETIITVTDTGIGMSNEVTNNLFNAQSNITTKGTKNEAGTGLGLLICKDLIERHKGYIKVESTLGKGSVFKICLPNKF